MLLDTSAWIEYLTGSKKGEVIKSLFIQGAVAYTCPLTIAEISSWCYKNNEEPFYYLKEIKRLSNILELEEEILIASGKTYYEERKKNSKIGIIDCIIYTTARFHDLILVTGDNDFKDLNYVKIL